MKHHSLLSPLNDASVDIVDEEGSLSFYREPEFTPFLYIKHYSHSYTLAFP